MQCQLYGSFRMTKAYTKTHLVRSIIISEYCPFKASCYLDAEPEPLGWINEQVVEDGHLRCQNVEGVKL
jgi:hypothetical protein